MQDEDEPITIAEACRLLGGSEKPIHPATFYRGVKSGIFPAPKHVAPNVSRVSRRKVLEARNRLMEAPDASAA